MPGTWAATCSASTSWPRWRCTRWGAPGASARPAHLLILASPTACDPRFALLYACGVVGGSVAQLVYFNLTAKQRSALLSDAGFAPQLNYAVPLCVCPRLWQRRGITFRRAGRSLGASAAVSAVITFSVLHNPWATFYLYFFIPMPAIVVGALLVGYDIYGSYLGTGSVGACAARPSPHGAATLTARGIALAARQRTRAT